MMVRIPGKWARSPITHVPSNILEWYSTQDWLYEKVKAAIRKELALRDAGLARLCGGHFYGNFTPYGSKLYKPDSWDSASSSEDRIRSQEEFIRDLEKRREKWQEEQLNK